MVANTVTAVRHWARRPFEYNGAELFRGQFFTLAGSRNDEKLIRLGYVVPVEDGDTGYECGKCGRVFIDLGSRDGHGKMAHRKRELTPEEEDREMDHQEKLLEQIAPLNLDKTAAKLKG